MLNFYQVICLSAEGVRNLLSVRDGSAMPAITELYLYTRDGCRLLTIQDGEVTRTAVVDNEASRNNYNKIVDTAMRVHHQTSQDAIDWLTGYDLILFSEQAKLMTWPTGDENDHDHYWTIWSTEVKRI